MQISLLLLEEEELRDQVQMLMQEEKINNDFIIIFKLNKIYYKMETINDKDSKVFL